MSFMCQKSATLSSVLVCYDHQQWGVRKECLDVRIQFDIILMLSGRRTCQAYWRHYQYFRRGIGCCTKRECTSISKERKRMYQYFIYFRRPIVVRETILIVFTKVYDVCKCTNKFYLYTRRVYGYFIGNTRVGFDEVSN